MLGHTHKKKSILSNARVVSTTLAFAFLAFGQSNLYAQTEATPADYVNPMVGTGGHGHTFPGAVWPFGMVQLSPDTRIDDSWDGCGGYYYEDSFIYGFSHTHLSGTGVSDYGDVLMMPTGGPSSRLPSFNPYAYRSRYSHSTEVAEAGYYSVYLPVYEIKVELTATERMGVHRYTYYGSMNQNKYTARVLIDLNHRDKLISHGIEQLDERRIGGWRQSKAWANNQWVYFTMEFDHEIARIVTSQDGKQAIVEFDFQRSDGERSNPVKLETLVGISFTDAKGARGNLIYEKDMAVIRAEAKGAVNFDACRAQAKDAWNQELSKIKVTSDYEAQAFRVGAESAKRDIEKRKFYTALYHCMIHPSLASDADGRYRGRDQQIHRAGLYKENAPPYHKVYSVFSLWDTYRALHPLLSIVDPDRTIDFVRTFLLQYKQGGKLPVWELGSCETECMIGYHSVSVIADVMMKEIGVTRDAMGQPKYPFDYKLALEAMIHSARLKDSAFLDLSGQKLGYMGIENTAESVSKLLEYAYDDWCIARVAQALPSTPQSVVQEFYARSERWKNLYDEKIGFMRPRVNGGWLSPFDPKEVNNHFTEANAWQYSMYVPHDILGLMDKLGGVNATEKHLDSLFGTDSRTTGRDQADISGLIGQYAHGNEPSHHMAYLYNYCGKPEKAQGIIDYVCKQFYKDSPDGLIGNEDCGQMSAWYVMSAMGLYPVCPGSNVYATGIPQFYEVEIAREGKSGFLITRGEINRKEDRAGPRMYPDAMTTAGATDGSLERSISGVGAIVKPVALKKPWAAHQMEKAKASELPALPTLKDLKGTPAARAAALKELQEQRDMELRSMRKVYAAAELTVTHQQLMQSDGLVFSEVDSADRDKLILKTAKQTVPTSFVAVPVIEGERTFRDSLRVRVLVPKGTRGVLEIRVSNRERVALEKKGKPMKQAKGKGAGTSAIVSALVVKPGTMETITAEADGAKPYEFVVAYDAVVSARLTKTEVYGGLPGSNPAVGKGDGLGSVTLGQSDWATGVFNKKENNYSIALGDGVIPHPQYSAGGAGALVDEIQGSKEWRAGGWMGFYDQDFSAVIDMGSVRSVSEVNARFLQDSRAWILMPRSVEVWSSADGVKYTKWPQAVVFKDDWQNNETLIDQLSFQHTDGNAGVKPIKARYVKVVADKYGKLPEGHLGYPYNGSGYIFIDEIEVR
ncbi:MAG: GH92 family glycosyl hydrolase [Bacteroidota bacterium]